jgi:replicative DNA helicase
MAAEIEGLQAQSNRKTGFPNLDAEAGSIYSGLYAVGGISSVGKTTFCHQLADQMAAQGQHVLFFSMEQSRLEMVSKSIARQTAKDDPEKAVSSLQIRTGAMGESIKRAIATYTGSVGDRVSIIEGNFRCTVSFIGDYTRQYIARNGGVKPVVVVDYLQVLQAEKDPETGRKSTDTKQVVDYNVTQLKRLSRDLEIPVFVISSVNRSNYLTPIDFEAFKESGGIEYTADVVWGLQLAAIHDPLFDKEGKIGAKREAIAQAKEAMPREIELVCLKNRYGRSRYTAQFTYYPQYDYFTPAQQPTYTAAMFHK